MKIIVIGAGKIGKSIVESVCKEGHNIIIIDSDSNVVNNLIESYDIMGIFGNGAALAIQKEAGVSSADLVVAVTSSDEINIVSCLLAHKLGAKDTIARVRNPEYLDQIDLMKDSLGLSMTINPEYEAAKLIARNLTLPEALKVQSFAKGKMELLELRIDEYSPLVDKNLIQIAKLCPSKVLVCAVKRGDEVFIPSGTFIIKANDKIHIAASHNNLRQFIFFASAKESNKRLKSIMLIGGGIISYYFCQLVNKEKYDLKIIDLNIDKCNELSTTLPNVQIINGDGSNQDILKAEGITHTDAFLALTGNDEENIIISMFAQKKGVKKIITKINNHNFHGLLESIGIASVISPKDIIANQIISYIRAKSNERGSNVKTIYKLIEGSIEAVEFNIKDNCKLLDKSLKDLNLKKNILIAGIIRDNNLIIPNGDDKIHINDSVIVITKDILLEDINEVLQ